MAAAQVVIGHIHGLHRDFANTHAHSSWLEQFQQAPEAWRVLQELLAGSTEEVVQHFAAHTLVTKLQAGHLPEDAAASGLPRHQVLRDELLRHLQRFFAGPASVRKQLLVALVDCALLAPADEDIQWLASCVKTFSESPQALSCLLELLAIVPEEAANRKVLVPAQRRTLFAASMLTHTTMVLDVLWKASQVSAAEALGALRAFAKWLHLQHANPVLRGQKRASSTAGGGSGPFTADLLKNGSLREYPLLVHSARIFAEGIAGGASLELCQTCADLLSEALGLTNEATGAARPVVVLVIETVVAAARQLLPLTQVHLEKWLGQDSELAARTSVLGRLLGELGGPWARLEVSDGHAVVVQAAAAAGVVLPQLGAYGSSGAPPVGPVLNDLVDVALHLCQLRNVDLAKHGLDFWYQALSEYFGAGGDEDDPFDEEGLLGAAAARATGAEIRLAVRNPIQDSVRRELEKPIFVPHMQKMVQSHWKAVRYPPEPELEEHFDWDDFVRFREQCSINITESCLIVGANWIIDYVGSILEEICATKQIAWQDIDACVFVLTGVASRAAAGQDTVIPKLIELLPQLPYSQTGFKSLLLRSAASRLVLFTSGYLALNAAPCKDTLRFLTLEHLPAIPPLPPAPDPDAKKYCEAIAADAVKMVLTAARRTIVQAENGTLWKDVVTAVIALVADPRFCVDSRAQLIFGIGQVLAVLEWSELETMLDIFVQRMSEPLAPLLAGLPPEPLGSRAVKTTKDGKAPPELKLFVAAISSVYNMPPPIDELVRPNHHPVLAVVEKHFSTIQRVCLYHTQYEELMEQVCLAFSYILGFSREYVPTSAVFVPMMKLMASCCEQHPQPFYMGLIRSVIGFFGAAVNDQLDAILVELTGLFVSPVARALAASGTAPTLPPPINQAAYEMLAELLRHWNLTSLSIRSTQWMPEVLDATLEAMPILTEQNQAVHERTVCAAMRFLRNVILWADPSTSRGEASPELIEMQKHAQAILAERPLPRGQALPRTVLVMARLLAAASANNPAKGEIAPGVAEVLRALLIGPFEYPVSQALPPAFQSLPEPLGSFMSEPESLRIWQQLRIEKGDSRRFTKSILQLAEQFAVRLKKAQFGSA